MATRVCLALVVLFLGACGAGSQGAAAPPGTGTDVQRPEPAPPGPAPAAAVCPAQGEPLAVAGVAMPPLEVLARFPVLGGPSFVAQEQAVYWVTYDSRGGPIGGGPTTIEGYRLVLGQTAPRLLWRQERPGNRGMFGKLWASGSDLVWMEFFPSKPPTSGALYNLPMSGGPATVVREGLRTTDSNGGMRSLGADDRSVYLSFISPVGISAVSRISGQVTSEIARPAAPTLAAFEGEHIYWIESDTLWRARRDGSDARLLASGVPAAQALAVYAGIAWVVPGRGSIQRLVRVDSLGASVVCNAALWPEPGYAADVIAGAGGVYLAIKDASGQPSATVWQVGDDNRGAWRVVGPEGQRQVSLLAARAEGLLLAVSQPDGWAIAGVARLRD